MSGVLPAQAKMRRMAEAIRRAINEAAALHAGCEPDAATDAAFARHVETLQELLAFVEQVDGHIRFERRGGKR